MEEGHNEVEVAEGAEEKSHKSFPSGHVACTLAAAAAISSVYPFARGAGVAATGIMSLARMVKEAHWPLDIVGGLVVGGVASAFAANMLKLSNVWTLR
ncbi:MAG: phosphatase PAP2 family protein [Verrucomicrobiaceae bacterium]|nr:MAG: phosphatase PAP2 family protein [Verrucomicrobiaceae bacterium]